MGAFGQRHGPDGLLSGIRESGGVCHLYVCGWALGCCACNLLVYANHKSRRLGSPVEGLYLAWRHFIHRTETQRFLEQSCWGNNRRWTDTEEGQTKEFQVLINMLFSPQLAIQTHLVNSGGGNTRVGSTGLFCMTARQASKLTLVLPGAVPEATRLDIALVAVDSNQSVRNVTPSWEDSLECEWLPIEEGMGLKLVGKVAELFDTEHLEVRVLYYSPLALMTGSASEGSPVVGGKMGVRYLIKGGKITVHGNEDGPLPSDKMLIEQPVSNRKLQPERTA